MKLSPVFILVFMIFMHYIGDFILQTPFIAQAKQKRWWKASYNADMPFKNIDEYWSLYCADYIDILEAHSFMWAFCIMLPIAINQKFDVTVLFMVILICNAFIHAFTDNLKANKFKINLGTDQQIHFAQIIITYLIYILTGSQF